MAWRCFSSPALQVEAADNIPEQCLISSRLWHPQRTRTPASFSTHLTIPLSLFSFSDTPDKVLCCLCRYRWEANVSPGCGGAHYIIDECRVGAARHAQIPAQIFYSKLQRTKKLLLARFCRSIRETDPPYVSYGAQGDGVEFTITLILMWTCTHTHS